MYCDIIWMFCGGNENNKVDELHKRALRCIYKEPTKTLDELLMAHDEISVHERNIQSLMSIIFCSLNGFCPDIALNYFQ